MSKPPSLHPDHAKHAALERLRDAGASGVRDRNVGVIRPNVEKELAAEAELRLMLEEAEASGGSDTNLTEIWDRALDRRGRPPR